MTYPEQLDTIQWKNKRIEILKRDAFKCQYCYNEKIVSELDKGFFAGYSFPNNKELFNIDNFGTERFMISGIKSSYSKFLTESAVIYSKKVPNWRRMVLGIRKFEVDEKIIFEKFALKINELQKKIETPWDYEVLTSTVSDIFKLKEKRRIEFIELNRRKEKTEFDWIFMLGLHIHHKYYMKDLLAWEYKDDALITLCQTCHEYLHKNQEIPIFNNAFEQIGNYKYCKRCHGAGIFPEYSHVQNGICFRCNGMRYEELITNVNK